MPSEEMLSTPEMIFKGRPSYVRDWSPGGEVLAPSSRCAGSTATETHSQSILLSPKRQVLRSMSSCALRTWAATPALRGSASWSRPLGLCAALVLRVWHPKSVHEFGKLSDLPPVFACDCLGVLRCVATSGPTARMWRASLTLGFPAYC